jgi:hypothetical protein
MEGAPPAGAAQVDPLVVEKSRKSTMTGAVATQTAIENRRRRSLHTGSVAGPVSHRVDLSSVEVKSEAGAQGLTVHEAAALCLKVRSCAPHAASSHTDEGIPLRI